MNGLGLADLRQRLAAFDDVRLDALCLDHFPDVYDAFSRGMRRDEKTTLLLDHCRREPGEIDRLTSLIQCRAQERARPVSVSFMVPRDYTPFVGRNEEVAEFCEVIVHAPETVYCLVGMGGVGKTALAKRVAYRLQDHFSDGVLWANVANSEPLAILDSWAEAYDHNFRSLPDLESRAAAVRDLLAEKKVLVILDDVQSVEKARPLLPGGPQCTVLVTTRSRDVAVALSGYEYPLGPLTAEDSCQLMAQIVGQERLTAEEGPAAEICQLLGHLPLAVEIAAQRLASRHRWRLADLAERLRDEKGRLKELKINDREVRTSFVVSWEALDAPLRRSFSLLAVFDGRPFTMPAFAAVAEADNDTAEDHLGELVALSLLAEEGDVYYRQHPLLAAFAAGYLGEDEAAYARVVRYYLEYAQQHRQDYAALEEEWDNLSAGIRTAHDRGLSQLVLDYAGALTGIWFAWGRYTEARQGYEWASQAAEAIGERRALAACLLDWGRACIEQRDYDEAEEHLSASLPMWEALADRQGKATSQYHLARIATEQTDYDRAQRLLAESRNARGQLGDIVGVAEVLSATASMLALQGSYEEADRLLQQALDLQEAAGDEHGSIATLYLLACVAVEQKALDRAEDLGRRALALCDKLQEREEQVNILDMLSHLYRRQNRLDLAQVCAEQSFQLLRSMGDLVTQAQVLYGLSMIYKSKRECDRALEIGLQGLELCQRWDYTLLRAYLLIHVGDVHKELGQAGEAQQRWHEALAIAEKLQHPKAIELATNRLAGRQ